MRQYIICAFLIIAIFLTNSSCSKEGPILYNNVAMGFLSATNQVTTDGIADEGLPIIYNIISGELPTNIDLGTRVIITCDIIGHTAGKDNEYDVNVHSIDIPISGEPIDSSTINEEDWPDAIAISEAWISGGYINMFCIWIKHRDSIKEHEFALVYDELTPDADTLHLRLVHNAHGEGFYNNTDEAASAALTTVFGTATFPIQGILPSSRNVAVKLSWKWHKSDGQYIFPETENHSTVYSVTSSSPAVQPSTKATISPLTILAP